MCLSGDGYYNQFSLDSFSSGVVDPVGAGDALLAYSALALFKTKSLVAAGVIGSVAAACECEIDGNVPIEPKDVDRRLDTMNIAILVWLIKFMRVIVVGLGVQGVKEERWQVMSALLLLKLRDGEGDYSSIEAVPLDIFDGAILCLPDDQKLTTIRYLISKCKHVMVEKPLAFGNKDLIKSYIR